jgi:transposase
VVLADKPYSSRAIRAHLHKRGIRAVIPVPADQRGHRLRRGSQGGRPPAFDLETHKQRNTVERCINRLKQWRGIATRYEKTATIYLAGLHIAGSLVGGFGVLGGLPVVLDGAGQGGGCLGCGLGGVRRVAEGLLGVGAGVRRVPGGAGRADIVVRTRTESDQQ